MGFVGWLSIMESWEFWLLAALGIVAIVVNAYAFYLSFEARMNINRLEEWAQKEKRRRKKRLLKAFHRVLRRARSSK